MKQKRDKAEVSSEAVILEQKVIRKPARLARLITELTPDLEYLLSYEVTPKQRGSYRERAGQALVFDLSNDCNWLTQRMNALCSEMARALIFKRYGVCPCETMEDARSRIKDPAKMKSIQRKSASVRSKVFVSPSDVLKAIRKPRGDV